MDWYQGGDDEAALVWDAAAVAEDPVPVPEDGCRRRRRVAARTLHLDKPHSAPLQRTDETAASSVQVKYSFRMLKYH